MELRGGSQGKRQGDAPDLIIEVLSPENEKLDRFTKMKHYAMFGVGE